MSYILDALRRADAERDRGNVPGIHAQGYGAPPASAAAATTPPWVWLGAGALAVAVAGGLAWIVVGPSGRGAVDATTAAAPAAAPAPATVSPAAPPPSALAAPPAVAATRPSETVAPPVSRPRTEPSAVARKPKPAAAPASTTAPTEARPSATAEKVYAVAELPDDIRRQLPALTVGGSMYSGKPADRLLILNGQVAHEGDKVGNDLVLQQIRLKSAVLNFKGYRYILSF